MAATQIAENLAFINWTVLAGLALGAYAAVVLLRRRTDRDARLPRLRHGLCDRVRGPGLAQRRRPAGARSAGRRSSRIRPSTNRVARRLGGFVALAFVALLVRRRSASAADRLELAALAAGALTVVFGAFGWGGGPVGAAALLVQLAVLFAATGGVFAAMILGHWYLVTPKLPEAPLILIARLLLGGHGDPGRAVRGMGRGRGGARRRRRRSGRSPVQWALFVWLRLIVGLIFPLVVSWAAVQTARTRSMESATGLLYINVGTIAAGTILAAGLYFGAGLLV